MHQSLLDVISSILLLLYWVGGEKKRKNCSIEYIDFIRKEQQSNIHYYIYQKSKIITFWNDFNHISITDAWSFITVAHQVAVIIVNYFCHRISFGLHLYRKKQSIKKNKCWRLWFSLTISHEIEQTGASGCINKSQSIADKCILGFPLTMHLKFIHAFALHGITVLGVFPFWTICKCITFVSISAWSIESSIFCGDTFRIWIENRMKTNIIWMSMSSKIMELKLNCKLPLNCTSFQFDGLDNDLWLNWYKKIHLMFDSNAC